MLSPAERKIRRRASEKARRAAVIRICEKCGAEGHEGFRFSIGSWSCSDCHSLPKRKRFARWIRAIYLRDAGICKICNLPVDWSLRGTTDDGAPEIDHVIPRSFGGVNRPYNFRLAHRHCNRDREMRDFEVDTPFFVGRFTCKVCGGDVPDERLCNRGGQPRTCSDTCSIENKKRNQANRNSKRKRKPVL